MARPKIASLKNVFGRAVHYFKDALFPANNFGIPDVSQAQRLPK
jgi:hypothetical protein